MAGQPVAFTPPLHSSFQLNPLPSVFFGVGSLDQLVSIAPALGSTFLIITGRGFKARSTHWSDLETLLRRAGVSFVLAHMSGEPAPEDIDRIVDSYGAENVDGVIAVGGGSVLDAGKAVAAMLPTGEKIEQFLEGVGRRRPDGRTLPFVAIPTTAGTGSEASANAVLTRPGPDGYKKSLRHGNYVPNYALIDPRLMLSCPPELTAACSMDAFSQLVEGFLSTRASLLTDVIAWSGLEAVERSLVRVYRHGDDLQARTDMAYAALCSGIVLANAGLGVIHGLAPGLGSLFSIPHGVVCGTLIGAGNAVTVKKLRQLAGSDPAYQCPLEKYNRLGSLFCGRTTEQRDAADCFVEQLHRLVDILKLPRLGQYGAASDNLDPVVETASNKNNPAPLDSGEIRKILLSRL